MIGPQDLRWRLAYADGSTFDEDPSDDTRSSLRHAPRHAIFLDLCVNGQARQRIDLRGDDHGRTAPIFYRWRGLALDGNGDILHLGAVAGRAHPTKGEATLWKWDEQRELLVECPLHMFDQATIEGLLV